MPPWGVDTLREQLTDYRDEYEECTPTPRLCWSPTGVTQGLTLLVRVRVAAGIIDIAVEAPSNAVQRQVLGRYGVRVWDVPVDDDGLVVELMAGLPCRAVIVTPGHQYPCGMVMSASRRNALITWAERVDGIVIEDDYDAVFRHDKKQVAALQAISPSRVALVGSVSKSLAPGLRLGWIVSSPSALTDLRTAKRDDDFGTSVLEQYALARLIAAGDYDRHVRRLRRHYHGRRDTILDALRREIPGADVQGYAAGLHLLLRLPPDVGEEDFIAAAEVQGVAVLGTSPMYGTQPPRPGFVIGYGRTSPSMLDEGARRLGAALRAVNRTKAAKDTPVNHRRVKTKRASTAVDYF